MNMQALIADLQNFAPEKSAGVNIPEDPAKAGTKTETSADTIKNAGPEGKGEAAKVPDITSEEPAGEHKVVEGDVAGEVPGGKPFVEGGKIANIDALRQKLATAFAGGKAAGDAAGDAGPDAKQASETPVVPFSYHVVMEAMMKSAAGREQIEAAVAEIHGVENAAAMMKLALNEQEEFETNLLYQQLERMEQEKIAAFYQQERERQQEVLNALIESASTEEEKQAALASFRELKRAEQEFLNSDDPSAHQSFSFGVTLAEKAAAAMAQDPNMDPAAMEAMMGAPEEGGEPSIEEVIAALEQLVQSGQISPEDAEALLAELMGGEGGMGGMGGEMLPGMEGMPPKQASELLKDIDGVLYKHAEFASQLIDS